MIQRSQRQDVTVIELGLAYDSLDDTALQELAEVLQATATTADPPCVVIDLTHTTFLASKCIELLLRAWKCLMQRSGTMALCGVQPFCAEVIHVTRLDTLWETFPTQEEAVAALGQGH